MKKNNSQEHEQEQFTIFRVSASPLAMAYTVNVDDDFKHPSQFADLVHILEHANDGDQVRICLTTDGGALHSILPLLGAMQMTEAHVHVHAMSDVASAGTFLLMQAHSVSMNDYVTVMCHEVSFGIGGTGSSVASHVTHTMKSSEKLIREMYKDFFTEAELEKMLSGTQYYMDKDEFIERYERRVEAMDNEEEECTGACAGCSCNELEEIPYLLNTHKRSLRKFV